MTDSVLICLYLLREGKRKELLVPVHMSFHAILQELEIADIEDRIIAEKYSGFMCDPNVSLQSLGVKNCMRFLIY